VIGLVTPGVLILSNTIYNHRCAAVNAFNLDPFKLFVWVSQAVRACVRIFNNRA
jgi:hypothetical protein